MARRLLSCVIWAIWHACHAVWDIVLTLAGLVVAVTLLNTKASLGMSATDAQPIYIACGALIGTILVLVLTLSLIPLQRSAEFHTSSVTAAIKKNRAYGLAVLLQIACCLVSFGFAMRHADGSLLPVEFLFLAASLDGMRWHWRITVRLIDTGENAARILDTRARSLMGRRTYDADRIDGLRREAAELAERAARRYETGSAGTVVGTLGDMTLDWIARFGSSRGAFENAENSFLGFAIDDLEHIANITVANQLAYTFQAILDQLSSIRQRLMRCPDFLGRQAGRLALAATGRLLANAARQRLTRPIVRGVFGVLAEPPDADRPQDVEAWERRYEFEAAADVTVQTCLATLKAGDPECSNVVLNALISAVDPTKPWPSGEIYVDRLKAMLENLEKALPEAAAVPHVVPGSMLVSSGAERLPMAAAYDFQSSAPLVSLLDRTNDFEQKGPLFALIADAIGSHIYKAASAEHVLGSGIFFLLRETYRELVGKLLYSAISLYNAGDVRWAKVCLEAEHRVIDLYLSLLLRDDQIKAGGVPLRQATDALDTIAGLAIMDLRRAFGEIARGVVSSLGSLLKTVVSSSPNTDHAPVLARLLAIQKCAETTDRGRALAGRRKDVADACRAAIAETFEDTTARDALILRAEALLADAPERTYLREPVDAAIEYRRFMAETPNQDSAEPAPPTQG